MKSGTPLLISQELSLSTLRYIHGFDKRYLQELLEQ
ncbi:hypothetical protein V6Z12_D07G164700 [Gossypium hirsutum]